MNTKTVLLLSLLLWVGSSQAQAGLFDPKGDTDEEKRQTVRKQRDETLAGLFKAQPELKDRLKGPLGRYASVRVSDPANLPHLRIGDTVLVTYTEALAIALEAVPKPPHQTH